MTPADKLRQNELMLAIERAISAEAEVEALTARVAELPALLTVAEAAATAQGMLAVHPPSFGAHLTAEGLLRSALALLGDKP